MRLVLHCSKGISSHEAARGHATYVDGIVLSVTINRIYNYYTLMFPVSHVYILLTFLLLSDMVILLLLLKSQTQSITIASF